MVGGAPVADNFAKFMGADFRGVSGSDAACFLKERLSLSFEGGSWNIFK